MTHLITSTINNHANETTMSLYTAIGKIIAEQAGASTMNDLAKVIAENCGNVKGFSARNLRRMRDFYITYSATPELMADAQTIGWTQNSVIMESCESIEEMAFYIALTKEENLSKTALVSAIGAKTFETSKQAKLQEKVAEIKSTTSDRVANVSDFASISSTNTVQAVDTHVEPFLSKRQPFHRGSGPPRQADRRRSRRSSCSDLGFPVKNKNQLRPSA